MLPVLQAKESLQRINEFIIAQSPPNSIEANRAKAQLEQTANRSNEEQQTGIDLGKMSPEMRQIFVESMGFRYVEE
jgi:hypothetical protein